MVTPPRADSSSWGGVFSCFFLLPCFHRGDIEARMGKPGKNHVLQSVVFSFFPPSLLPQGWHRDPYGQTTKKPRFTKCGFFVFFLRPCFHRGDIETRMGKPRKKPRFTKCGFFVFSSVLASNRGDIETRMGKPRKNHVLQSVVFSFFPPSLLPQGWHRDPYGQTTKKPRFTKCGFFVFSSVLASTGVT